MPPTEDEARIANAIRQQQLREWRYGKKSHRPGDVMKDGSIFAGISPQTGKPLYVMPQDEAVPIAFVDQESYARRVNREEVLGHDDWRVPALGELQLLFSLREKGALQGTFNAASYWSSTLQGDVNGWMQSFEDGKPDFYDVICKMPVRLVR